MDEIKELFEEKDQEKKSEVNPFDYMTIKISEYRKLIKKVERYKSEAEALKQISEWREKANDYRRWWKEEEAKAEENKANFEAAKAQIEELLNIKEDKSDADDGR